MALGVLVIVRVLPCVLNWALPLTTFPSLGLARTEGAIRMPIKSSMEMTTSSWRSRFIPLYFLLQKFIFVFIGEITPICFVSGCVLNVLLHVPKMIK